MKLIKSEKLEKSMYELQFSIDAETLCAAADKAFKREGKKYTVQGFRKGHAPRKTIEKMYGEDIFLMDAINDLFPDEYEAAVKEAGLEPVGNPQPEVVSLSAADGAVLKAVLPVKPEVTLGEYVGLKATKTVHPVDDAQVEEEITRMRERNARMITSEEPARLGDTADLDFEGFVDGVAFEGGKAEHYNLELGSGTFIPGFEDQVQGHSAGDEFDVNVTFPEDYQAAELAGKPAVFKIKLHEVKSKELPELDDEFAKDVSEFDTMDELRASIRKNMEEADQQQADLDVENALVDQVIDGMQAEIPQAMVDNSVDEMIRDFGYRLSQQGLKLEEYLKYVGEDMAAFRANFAERAEKQVKIRLALEAVAAKENIVASDEEFEAEVKRIADQHKMEPEKVKAVVDAEAVKKDLAINKAIDFIKSKAEVTEETAKAADAQ